MDRHAAPADNKALSDEVLRRMGRNLLLFQQIEYLLKFLVVHHRADGTADSLLPRQQARAEKAQTQTLGTLARQYGDEVLSDGDAPGPEADVLAEDWFSWVYKTSGDAEFDATQRADMQMMVDERNQLVHHFLPRWRPDSPERMAKALIYLETQRGKVLPMFEHLKTVMQSLQTARQVVAAVVGSDDFERAFELQFLQHSPLVAVLCEVAVQKARADGWANLADAGRIARVEEADAMANMKARYGRATLKRLLIAADLFDVVDELLPGRGSRTIYRIRSASEPQA